MVERKNKIKWEDHEVHEIRRLQKNDLTGQMANTEMKAKFGMCNWSRRKMSGVKSHVSAQNIPRCPCVKNKEKGRSQKEQEIVTTTEITIMLAYLVFADKNTMETQECLCALRNPRHFFNHWLTSHIQSTSLEKKQKIECNTCFAQSCHLFCTCFVACFMASSDLRFCTLTDSGFASNCLFPIESKERNGQNYVSGTCDDGQEKGSSTRKPDKILFKQSLPFVKHCRRCFTMCSREFSCC